MEELAGAIADPDAFFALPDRLPEVERSRVVETAGFTEYWLRFPSPGLERDTVYAHVYEPRRKPAGGMPTLIFGHGLAIETEMMKGDVRGYAALTDYGLRVILPDGPGHNRRLADGLYGGESFINAPPRSALRHLAQAAKEFGILAAGRMATARGMSPSAASASARSPPRWRRPAPGAGRRRPDPMR
jgi:hypothetical protein